MCFWWDSKLAGALTFEFPIYSLMPACQKLVQKGPIFKMGFIRLLNSSSSVNIGIRNLPGLQYSMDPFPSILSASSHQIFWIASVFDPLWFSWEAAWFYCSLLQARLVLSFSNPSPWPCWRHFASCALLPIRIYIWLLDFSWESTVGFFSFLSGLHSLVCAALRRGKTTVLPLYCSATLSWIKLNKPKRIVLHFSKGKTFSSVPVRVRSLIYVYLLQGIGKE